jgi:uncharacterized protein (TIGR01777 family)
MTTSLRIAITGATGMLGTALTPVLSTAGHQVIPMSRRNIPGGIIWDPLDGKLNPADLEGVDAVIHLAGENLAEGRWTADRKALLRQSRTASTRLLATAMASRARPPAVLICASAIGIYGNRGDEVLDETSAPGSGFLAELVRDWEASADPARDAGIRVVHARFGVILSRDGGALAKMVTPFKLGLGGPFGDGQQWLSWVAMADVLGMITAALTVTELSGPINVTAPEPLRNRDFVAALGQELGRPAVVPIPAFALRLALGEMADEALLASARVLPRRLEQAHFTFRFPELRAALHSALAPS